MKNIFVYNNSLHPTKTRHNPFFLRGNDESTRWRMKMD